MNWQIILLYSLFGVLMGILSVNGFTKKIEPLLWILFGLFTAFMVARNVPGKAYLHGFFIGLSWGIFNAVLQSLFFDTYIKNNPKYREAFQKRATLKPRYFFLFSGLMIGVVTGIVLGGLVWLCSKIF